MAVLAAGCGAALLVLAASRWGRKPGRPLLSALLGAASGAAVAAACRGLQLESPPYTPGPVMKTCLVLLAVLSVGALLGMERWLPRWAALPRPRVSLGLAAVALAAAAAVSRSGLPRPLPEPPGRTGAAPPIVLIILDTLRADHLRSYGYGRDTMPRLERFARQHAIRIERATSNAPSSLEAHGSLFTGLLPHRHGAHKPAAGEPRPPAYGHALRQDVPTLALLLRRAGYWPVGISANFGPLSPEFGLSRGFGFYEARSGLQRGPALYDPFRFALWRRWPLATLDRLPPFSASDFFELGVPYRRAGEIADRALEALDRAGETPLFLFLNFMEPHYPYRPPRSFTGIFPGIRRPGLRRLDDEQAAAAEIMAGRRAMTAEEQVAWNAAYDSGLLYLDGELARVLDALRRHPRFGETLVVITSDHGEAFGEHGLFRHSTALYDEMLAVPLFLKPGARRPPGFNPGRSLPGPFQPVDLFPTLLDHAGMPVPSGIDGYAWGRGRRAAFAESYPHPPAASLGERPRPSTAACRMRGSSSGPASSGLGDGPIIHPGMPGLEGELGASINGPSLISVPDWVRKPVGRYYLYFAHHHGGCIRLAYADRLEGPWKIHSGRVLPLADRAARHHVAGRR